MKELNDCSCPNIPCELRGNCVACVAKSRGGNTLTNCMEKIAENLGAQLPLSIPQTYVCASYEKMSEKSAQLIAESVFEKPEALICLPAGSTALRTFQILKEMNERGEVDFSKASFVALDEWLDLEDDSENCTAFMFENFYNPLHIAADKITLFDVHAVDMKAECKRVDEAIFKQGGIDCMLLGIGMNGHLGLNEPGESFNCYAKVINLDPVTAKVGQKYFANGMKLTRGITLGIRHMFESKKVILQAGTKNKAEIISQVYHSRPTEEIPATVLKLLEHSVIVLDEDAAEKIKELL